MRPALLFLLLVVVPQSFKIIRRAGEPQTWMLLAAYFVVFSPIVALCIRFSSTVRVTPDGIRGVAGNTILWNEMTEVEDRGRGIFGGLHVRSTYKNTVIVSRSIASTHAFLAAVERHASGSVIHEVLQGLSVDGRDGDRGERQ